MRILLAFLMLAGAAHGATFTDLGVSEGEPRISQSGDFSMVESSGDCVVVDHSVSPVVTTTLSPAGTVVDCADVEDRPLWPWGFSGLINTDALGFGIPDPTENKFAVQVTNSAGVISFSAANSQYGRVSEGSDDSLIDNFWNVGEGHPLTDPVGTDLVPSIYANGDIYPVGFDNPDAAEVAVCAAMPPGQERDDCLLNVTMHPDTLKVGKFLGVSQDGKWAAGKRTDNGGNSFRPFFYEYGADHGITMLTLGGFDPDGWPIAIVTPFGACCGPEFVAVGQVDLKESVFGPTISSGIRWVGIEDSPDRLMGPDPSLDSQAVTIRKNAVQIGGNAGGKAIIWENAVGDSIGHDLNTLIGGPVPAGWVLTSVTGIALEDDVFVGTGTLSGVERNFRLDMEGVNVPEPGMGVMLMAGIGALVAMRKRG